MKENRQAVDLLTVGRGKEAFELLKKTEDQVVKQIKNLGQNDLLLKLLSVTLNNIACYYKTYDSNNTERACFRYRCVIWQMFCKLRSTLFDSD